MFIILHLLSILLLLQLRPASSESQQQRKIRQRTISTSRRWAHTPSNTHLQTRQEDHPDPFSQNCTTYYSANTPHAVCNGNRSIMCLAGCTGGIVAQNCQLNSSSPLTTQTCSIAFSQTSETAYLCNTPEGAYTCQGPNSGSVVCNGCVSTPNGVVSSNSTLYVNGTPMTGAPESHLATGQQDSSTNSYRLLTFGSASCSFVLVPLLITGFFVTIPL